MPSHNCWHNELENSSSKFLLNSSMYGCLSTWDFIALAHSEASHRRCYLKKLPTASSPLCAPPQITPECQFIPRAASKV